LLGATGTTTGGTSVERKRPVDPAGADKRRVAQITTGRLIGYASADPLGKTISDWGARSSKHDRSVIS
jgi:hypothetical protein